MRECCHFVVYSVLQLYEIDGIMLFDQYNYIIQTAKWHQYHMIT